MATTTSTPTWDELVQSATGLGTYTSGTGTGTATSGNTVSALIDALSSYVKSAGTKNDNQDLINKRSDIEAKLREYDAVIAGMKTRINALRNDANANTTLQNIETLREEIVKLEAEKREFEEDKNTSDGRREAVQNAGRHVSYPQLFGGLSRPIKKIFVPILVTLIVFFLMVGAFMIYRILVHGSGAGAAANANTGAAFNIQRLIGGRHKIRK
jgi:hypothetical protein